MTPFLVIFGHLISLLLQLFRINLMNQNVLLLSVKQVFYVREVMRQMICEQDEVFILDPFCPSK